VRGGLIKVVAGIAVAMALVAGCSDKQSGTATLATTTGGTTTGPTTTKPTTTSSGGAPAVKVPLDATKYLPQPCTALSAGTLAGLNVSRPGIPDTTSPVAQSSGPSCIWHTDDQPLNKSYDVGFLTGNKNGLADTYRGGKTDFPGYFEPTDVGGYPAVFNGLTEDRPAGSCNITVGISSTLSFRVGLTADKDTGTRSCDLVKQVAAAVIQTLKGA
jgi:uncharacterized protein DUF3558